MRQILQMIWDGFDTPGLAHHHPHAFQGSNTNLPVRSFSAPLEDVSGCEVLRHDDHRMVDCHCLPS